MRDYMDDLEARNKVTGEEILKAEKLRVVIWPVALTTGVYGLILFIYPGILENYSVYQYVDEVMNPKVASIIFVVLSALMIAAYLAKVKSLLRIITSLLIAIWFIFAVSFFISPPPNTIWIFSSLMVYLTINIARRI